MPPQKSMTPPPATPSPTPSPTPQKLPSVEEITNDPEFLNMEHDEQVKVLSAADPEFRAMDRLAQDGVIASVVRARQPAGMTPGLQKTLSRPPRGAEVFFTDPMQMGMGPILALKEATKSPTAPFKVGAVTAKEFFAQPLRELAGAPQPGEDPDEYEAAFPQADAQGFHRPALGERLFNALSSATGGNPAAARESLRSGDKTGAYAHALTVPLLTFGLGKLMELPRKQVSATRREVSALQTVSKGAIKGTGPENAASRVEAVQQLLKQAMQKNRITDENIDKQIPIRERAGQGDIAGNVARGNERILKVARDAVDLSHQPIEAVLSRYGPHPAGPVPKRVAAGLRDEAKNIGKVNEPLARAISDLADKVEAAKTFNELNELKSHANKMLDQIYSSIPGTAIDATAERAYAYKLAADAIRQEMYPELQRLSGSSIDLIKVGQREADAISMRDGLFQHYFQQVAPEQMSKEAATFWEYTLAAQGAPGHSLFSRHIIARGLEKAGVVPTGGGQFSKQATRGIGPTGKGMQPERVAIRPGGGQNNVIIGPGAPGLGGHTTRSISIGGAVMGSIVYDISGDTLTIHHLGGPQTNFQAMANTLGRVGIMQMLEQLRTAHPNVNFIAGVRVGGARGAAGRTVRVPISRIMSSGPPPGISIIPYRPGTVKRFPNATRKLMLGARGARAAEGAVKKMTPPPELPEDEEPEQ